MVTLKSRFGLQGLGSHGLFIADQPGLVLDGKPIYFLYFYYLPVDPAKSAFEVARPLISKAIDDHRAVMVGESRDLHLYYFDADGNGILSVRHQLTQPLNIMVGDQMLNPTPLKDLILERRYEAEGAQGHYTKTLHDKHDAYYNIEKFLASYTWGWAGLFHNRDRDDRTRLFRDFQPWRSGLFNPTETIRNLHFRMKLGIDDGQDGQRFFREVRINLPEATLEEALNLP